LLVDQRSDIFSFGVVLYELLTGLQPFAGPTLDVVFQRVMTATPRPVLELNPAAGRELSDVIAKMLAKDPAHRHASCREVMEDLARARAGIETSPPGHPLAPAEGVTRPRGRRALAAGALAVVAVAIPLLLGPGRQWLGPSLPADRNLAVLAPVTPGATEEFASFALGAFELLSRRLQEHQDQPGFQLASFREGVEEKLESAKDAHKVLGTNLVLTSSLEQRTDVFRARLDLWDARRDRIVRTRAIEVPTSRPFELLDRMYSETAAMAGLTPRSTGAAAEIGVRGTGTLRFLAQGIGRMRRAQTEPEARRAAEDLELACRTEPEAAAVTVILMIVTGLLVMPSSVCSPAAATPPSPARRSARAR
jgi:hypothetical protein